MVELWSGGFRRRLTTKRAWVRIMSPDTRCITFHIFVVKIVLLWWKRGRGWPILEVWSRGLRHCYKDKFNWSLNWKSHWTEQKIKEWGRGWHSHPKYSQTFCLQSNILVASCFLLIYFLLLLMWQWDLLKWWWKNIFFGVTK